MNFLSIFDVIGTEHRSGLPAHTQPEQYPSH